MISMDLACRLTMAVALWASCNIRISQDLAHDIDSTLLTKNDDCDLGFHHGKGKSPIIETNNISVDRFGMADIIIFEYYP